MPARLAIVPQPGGLAGEALTHRRNGKDAVKAALPPIPELDSPGAVPGDVAPRGAATLLVALGE